ncbi:hypothetical protein [Vibrio sp.]|uniref:hypothetical protein n=1 Tax=Vibrio sp. TaxID=678 RepID=UPI003AA821DE
MDTEMISTLEQKIYKLEKLLRLDGGSNSLIRQIALGLLSEEVQNIWWRSEEPFTKMPSPQLQDDMALFAMHAIQNLRQEPELFEQLSSGIKAYHQCASEYQWDLSLHMQRPEWPLLKYWLASINCCCRAQQTHQVELWNKHLRLTHSMLIGQYQKAMNPDCIVGYAECEITIINLEKHLCAIISHQPFEAFQIDDMIYLHYSYPT